MALFQALYGRLPPTVPDYVHGSSTIGSLDTSLQQRLKIMNALRDNLKRTGQRKEDQANKHREEHTFEPGEWVLLRLQPYRQHVVALRQSHELSKCYYDEGLARDSSSLNQGAGSTRTSEPMIADTRGNLLRVVSKAPVGQGASSHDQHQPRDGARPMLQQYELLAGSTIRVPPFSSPKETYKLLDHSSFPQARSQPLRESIIRVPPVDSSKASRSLLDQRPLFQAQSQPSSKNTIRVINTNATNLEDKCLSPPSPPSSTRSPSVGPFRLRPSLPLRPSPPFPPSVFRSAAPSTVVSLLPLLLLRPVSLRSFPPPPASQGGALEGELAVPPPRPSLSPSGRLPPRAARKKVSVSF
ncbi:hypothetical protein SESBI_13339 [Sesbania bispinosa]|nr:hypothetical protein SESBI_13339 [Sesbania bispinosa]